MRGVEARLVRLEKGASLEVLDAFADEELEAVARVARLALDGNAAEVAHVYAGLSPECQARLLSVLGGVS